MRKRAEKCLKSGRTAAAALAAYLGLSLAAPASAGEFTAIGETGGTYAFTRCDEPVPPQLDDKKERSLRRSSRRRAELTRQYNNYVASLNAYFLCLQEEAQADIDRFYRSVDASFNDRQKRALEKADAIADKLNLKPSADAQKLDEELLGGEPN